MKFDLKKKTITTGERDPDINEYHKWLNDNGIPYDYYWASADDPRSADFVVKFENEEDLMAFKLRWM